MVAGKRNVTCVPFQGCNKCLRRVIPDLDGSVIRCRKKVWLIRLGIVIDMVDTLGFMGFQGEVGVRRAKAPDLHGTVQTSGSEGVRILGVDSQPHHIVAVALVHLDTLPAPLPIPQLDCHVIRRRKNKRLGGVHCDGTNVIRMRLKRGNLLGGVVIVDAKLEVIGTADNPVLASDETTGSYRDIGEFEGFDDRLDSLPISSAS